VNIHLDRVTCLTYPEKFIRDNAAATSVLLSIAFCHSANPTSIVLLGATRPQCSGRIYAAWRSDARILRQFSRSVSNTLAHLAGFARRLGGRSARSQLYVHGGLSFEQQPFRSHTTNTILRRGAYRITATGYRNLCFKIRRSVSFQTVATRSMI